MNIIHRRGWELPESLVTPEPVAMNRRSVLAGAALSVAGGLLLPGAARADGPMAPPVNEKYKPGRAVTPEKAATTYNNYYEFSEDKNLWQAAQKMTVSPWSVQIDGLVKTPRSIAYEDLLKQVQLEQRIYRHRCVEAWSMVVPWTGFPMSQLVKIAEPLGSAKYVVFTTVEEPKVMPGLNEPIYPWPYVEGVTIEEAGNELAFITVGMYGKDLPKQNGAPVRMTLPWKYGFKSGKAFVKVSFTEKRPQTMWAAIDPDEYGFWANVNPAVPHPRWSQATERVLGTNERVPTLIYNGYGEYVSSLYDGLKGEKLFDVILQRILAVLAAVFLVGAVAVATLEPPDMPLGALLLVLDHDLSSAAEDGMQARLSYWMWDDLVMPVLLRPAWLLPAAIGLVLAGVSLTLSTRQRSQRTHGRRF